jgi:hypothetical protein
MNARSFAAIVAVAAILCGAACSAPSRNRATTTSSTASVASTSASSTSSSTVPLTTPVLAVVPTTIAPPSRVGATVLVPSGNLGPPTQVTLVNVVDPAAGADQFAVPVAGDRYVGVRLRVVFGGTSPVQEDFAGDTSVDDSQDSSYSSTPANLQSCPAFKPGLSVSPGQTATGCVTFEVSATATIADVTFTLGGQMGSVSAEWSMS